jgi:RimJ/RimL family protein N-acetyltransferase
VTATDKAVEVNPGFPRHLLPRVWQWILPHKSKLIGDYGPQSMEAFMQEWDFPTTLANAWTVQVDGEVGGIVHFSQPFNGVMEMHAYFPHYTFKSSIMQRGLEGAIQRAFAANADARKIEWRGFETCSTMVHVLRKVGGGKDARIENGALQDGRWCPIVQMGILREKVI